MRNALARFGLALLIGIGGCTSSPTAPTVPPPAPGPPIPQFEGVWHGEHTLTSCNAPRRTNLCRGVGLPRYTLRLRQTGRDVVGVLELWLLPIQVRGLIDSSGELVLTGRKDPASRFDRSAELRNLSVRIDGSGALIGQLDYSITFPGEGYGTSQLRGLIATSMRGEPGGLQTWTGVWEGQLVVRTCTIPAGSLYCLSDEVDDLPWFSLSLEGSGVVSGVLGLHSARIPVFGVANGTSVTLEGEGAGFRLDGWTMEMDDLGRISGRVSYVQSYLQRSTTYVVDLVNVIPVSGR